MKIIVLLFWLVTWNEYVAENGPVHPMIYIGADSCRIYLKDYDKKFTNKEGAVQFIALEESDDLKINFKLYKVVEEEEN